MQTAEPTRAGRQERRIRVAANGLALLPALTVSAAVATILYNRYEQPTDAPDAGQGSGILVGFVLMLVVTGGVVGCSLLRTSPGSVVLRRGQRGRRRALAGMALVNIMLAMAAFGAYRALAIDRPDAPTLPLTEVKLRLLGTRLDPARLPAEVRSVEVDESGQVKLQETSDGALWFSVATKDGERAGTVAYFVKASAGDAKDVSRKWSSDDSFGWHKFEYPSLCERQLAERQHACFVRVGQTLIVTLVRGASEENKGDEDLTIALARSAVTHLEAVIAAAAAGLELPTETPTLVPTSTPSPSLGPASTPTPAFEATIHSVRVVRDLPDRLVVDVEYSYSGPLAWLLAQRMVDGTSRGSAHSEQLTSADPALARTARIELACDSAYLPGALVAFRVSIRISMGPWITWPADLQKQCP